MDGPFAVINADDYYGPEAFRVIYDYLMSHEDDRLYRFAMVGYQVENTLTENGSVARGVCETDAEGHLVSITERTKIERADGRIVYEEDGEGTGGDSGGHTGIHESLGLLGSES